MTQKICGTCEYFDALGDKSAMMGDCHNRHGHRFTPGRYDTYPCWVADTTGMMDFIVDGQIGDTPTQEPGNNER